MHKLSESVFRYYYYAYIGFALGVAVFYFYMTLGGYISPAVSIGSYSVNLAELVAAIFGAATVFAVYLRYVEEGRAAEAQRTTRRTAERRRR